MLKHVTTSDAQVIGVRRCQVLKVPSNLIEELESNL